MVQRIFTDAAAGIGKQKIASMLNREGVAPFGRGAGWQPSYIDKLLKSRAVLGEFQPHHFVAGKRMPVGDAVADYFPQIVSADLFTRARSAVAGRRVGFSGRKGPSFANLLTGMCRCDVCNGSMTFRNKGGATYLTCDNAMRACRVVDGEFCPNRTYFNYDQIETLVLDNVLSLALLPSDFTDPRELSALRQALAEQDLKIEDLERKQDRLLELVEAAGTDVERAAVRLRSLQEQLRDARHRRQEAASALEIATGRNWNVEHLGRLAEFREELSHDDADVKFRARAKAHQALKSVIEYISFDPSNRTVEVALVGGVAAFRFRDGEVVQSYNHLPEVGAEGGIREDAVTAGSSRRKAGLSRLLRSPTAAR